jgi:thiamine-phosphate pyrophosphorylase
LCSRLYVITPLDLAGTDDLAGYVEAILSAGAGMIQYRAKGVATRRRVEDCRRILRHTRRLRVPLIVNDRVDVALAAGAEGVHVGPSDMPVAYARRLMGPHAIVGATAPTPKLAREAQEGGASYVSVGPMYATPSAPEKHPVGPEGIAAVRSVTTLPICAIGGINEQTLAAVAGAGPDIVALIGAIAGATDPAMVARRLAASVEQLIGNGELRI